MGASLTDLVMVVPPFEVGEYTYFGEYCHVSQHTKIGKYCSIANLCTIGAQSHRVDGLTTWPFLNDWVSGGNEPTTIGNDVWIGCNAVVMSGLTIGDGAVIGAGAVVTRSVPAYAVVYGNPARVHGFRFDEATIARLLASRWWDLPHEKIRSLPIGDVLACIELLTEGKTNGRSRPHAETYPAEV